MNPAYLHLITNHLPVVGIPLIAVLVAWGLWRRSRDVVKVGLGLTVVVAAVTYPVFLTGERAEDVVEDRAWANHDAIEAHEARGKTTLIIVLITGGLAVLALWQLRGDRPLKRTLPALVLGAMLMSSASLAWSALTGGEIRHDEIREDAISNPATASDRSDEGDHREREER